MYHSPKGSVWRKWDLHFHTPSSSHDYKDKSVTNQMIVDRLVESGIRVVAITDHHVIDVDRIKKLQELGEGKLTVLPGIECCSELGGSKSVHFIGIFPEDCKLDNIWSHISAELDLTSDDIKNRGGDNAIYTEIKKAANLIHKYDGIVSIHAGKKENSIEEISSKELFKQVLSKSSS